MAILGFQLVTTLCGVTILSKIIARYPIIRFLYNGLTRSLVPSDEYLLELVNAQRSRGKNKKRRLEFSGTHSNQDEENSKSFYFPRALPISLQCSKLSYIDTVTLPLYSNCQWLLDFWTCTLFVYLVNEFTHVCCPQWFDSRRFDKSSAVDHFNSSTSSASNTTAAAPPPPKTRMNLSLVWLTLTLWFTIRTLCSMTAIYFRRSSNADNTGGSHANKSDSKSVSSSPTEWALILAAGFCSSIISGLLVTFDGKFFDFHLDDAYLNLTFPSDAVSRQFIISRGAFHLWIVLVASVVGGLLIFPSLKIGKLYLDDIRIHRGSRFRTFLLNMALFAPLFPIVLWTEPVVHQLKQFFFHLTLRPDVAQHPILLFLASALTNCFSAHVDSLRLSSCMLAILMRLVTLRWNLQTYLLSAQDKLDRLNHEPGRTSNKDVRRLVASIFYCFNLVTLQCLTPIILLCSILCVYKTTSGLSWLPFSGLSKFAITSNEAPASVLSFTATAAATDQWSLFNEPFNPWLLDSWHSTFVEARVIFGRVLDRFLHQLTFVARGTLGFFTLWCLFVWQLVSLIGYAYYRSALD